MERIESLYKQTKEVEVLLFKTLDSDPNEVLLLEERVFDFRF